MGFGRQNPLSPTMLLASVKHSKTSALGDYQHSKLQQPPPNYAKILLSNPQNEIVIKPAPRVIFQSPKPVPVLIHMTCFPAVCPWNNVISLTKPPKVMARRRLLSHQGLRGAKVVKNGSLFGKSILIFGILFPAFLPPAGATKLLNPIKWWASMLLG